MTRRARRITRAHGAIAIVLLAAAAAAILLPNGDYRIEHHAEAGRPPKLFPDYSGIRIPFNIAPLNFVIEEPGNRYQVRIRSADGGIVISSPCPGIRIPAAEWRKLLRENRGEKLRIDVFVDDSRFGWVRFQTIFNEISADPIDPFLVYRDISPQFYLKADMRLKQRSLEGFDERTILDHRQLFMGGCFNCHSFFNYQSDRFVFQVRYKGQNYMVLSDRGRVTLIQPVFHRPGSAYLSWHPGGDAIALTGDMGYEIFNLMAGMVPEEVLEYADTAGDVGVYRISENRVSTTPALSREDRVETQPAWSADGKYLYFVSAPRVSVEKYEDIKYDLRRIPYDIDTDTWGESETLISAARTGLSCTFPRASPDGKYLLFCMTDRSSFSILRSKTDLYIMDLASGSYQRLPINSDRTDSYHSWASNSKWFAFVSKRRDGVHGLVYFSHIDGDGKVSKPFVLPQRDPHYYESFVRTYNVPEFVREPIRTDRFVLGSKASAVERIRRSR